MLPRVHEFPHFAVETDLRFLQAREPRDKRGFILSDARRENAFRFNDARNLGSYEEIEPRVGKRTSFARILTRKKSQVEPWASVPYCTSVCDAKSSGELIGVTILSIVKNAARFAV